MNRFYLWMLVIGVTAAMVAPVGAVSLFRDDFNGTAADPDAGNWNPNDAHVNFDSRVEAGRLILDSTAGGMGGASTGVTHFWNGPLAKVGAARAPGFDQIWTWQGSGVNHGTQTDFNGNPRWVVTDVFFAPAAPPATWTNDNQTAVNQWIGVRIRHDGNAPQAFVRDQVPGDTISNLDTGGLDVLQETTWQLTIHDNDTFEIAISQGGPMQTIHGPAALEGDLASATEFYPVLRMDNSSDWEWSGANPGPDWVSVTGVSSSFDFIEAIPEPATLGLLAAGLLLAARRRR